MTRRTRPRFRLSALVWLAMRSAQRPGRPEHRPAMAKLAKNPQARASSPKKIHCHPRAADRVFRELLFIAPARLEKRT